MEKRKRATAQSGERGIKEQEIEEMRERMTILWDEETRLIGQKERINRRLSEIEKEKMEIHIPREKKGSGNLSKEEPEMCEVCGKNPASIGIPQMDETMFYLCDDCYAERGIEGEEIEELNN